MVDGRWMDFDSIQKGKMFCYRDIVLLTRESPLSILVGTFFGSFLLRVLPGTCTVVSSVDAVEGTSKGVICQLRIVLRSQEKRFCILCLRVLWIWMDDVTYR